MRVPVMSDDERQQLMDDKAFSPHTLVVKKAEALQLMSRAIARGLSL